MKQESTATEDDGDEPTAMRKSQAVEARCTLERGGPRQQRDATVPDVEPTEVGIYTQREGSRATLEASTVENFRVALAEAPVATPRVIAEPTEALRKPSPAPSPRPKRGVTPALFALIAILALAGVWAGVFPEIAHDTIVIGLVALAAAALLGALALRYLRAGAALAAARGDNDLAATTVFEAKTSAHGVAATMLAATSRLNQEVARLTWRGNVSLVIGSLTASGAAAFLLYFARGSRIEPISMAALLAYYVPKLSAATFVLAFAFFFLRLYRSTLLQIQDYQAMLTALACQQALLEMAVSSGDRGMLRDAVRALAAAHDVDARALRISRSRISRARARQVGYKS
jgi:hypothetical protein